MLTISICACRPDLLYPRDACTAEFVAGRVWVMGGVNGSGKNSAVESIAPGETAWREEPEPTPGETKSSVLTCSAVIAAWSLYGFIMLLRDPLFLRRGF